jgi:hypothetical protein
MQVNSSSHYQFKKNIFTPKYQKSNCIFWKPTGYFKMVICKALLCLQSSACRFVLNNPTHQQLLHPDLIQEARKWRWLMYHSFAVKFLAEYYKLQLCGERNVCPWVVISTKNETWHFRDRLQASETVIRWVTKLVWNLCVWVFV